MWAVETQRLATQTALPHLAHGIFQTNKKKQKVHSSQCDELIRAGEFIVMEILFCRISVTH